MAPINHHHGPIRRDWGEEKKGGSENCSTKHHVTKDGGEIIGGSWIMHWPTPTAPNKSGTFSPSRSSGGAAAELDIWQMSLNEFWKKTYVPAKMNLMFTKKIFGSKSTAFHQPGHIYEVRKAMAATPMADDFSFKNLTTVEWGGGGRVQMKKKDFLMIWWIFNAFMWLIITHVHRLDGPFVTTKHHRNFIKKRSLWVLSRRGHTNQFIEEPPPHLFIPQNDERKKNGEREKREFFWAENMIRAWQMISLAWRKNTKKHSK